jgi:hypothetical protein
LHQSVTATNNYGVCRLELKIVMVSSIVQVKDFEISNSITVPKNKKNGKNVTIQKNLGSLSIYSVFPFLEEWHRTAARCGKERLGAARCGCHA